MIAERYVLDLGYIRLLDKMGDDAEVARAARVSYGKYDDIRDWDKDAKLTKYLKDHGHTSPFEMIELKWQVKCPIFVARQWMRHRTFNYNEISYRYTEAPDEFYTPAYFRSPAPTNKQGSGELLSYTEARAVQVDYETSNIRSLAAYRGLLASGVSREQARMVLPVSTYTEFICKNDLNNTLKFLTLRDSEDSQYEIHVYAQAMKEMIKECLPRLSQIIFS